jgi:hypothetical protein
LAFRRDPRPEVRVDGRTVQRIIRRLVDGGHLLVDGTAGGRGSNLYTIVMARPDELSTPPADRHPRQSATGGDLPPHPRQDAGAPPAQLRHPNVLDPSLNKKRARTRARGAANPPPRGAARCTRHLGQFAESCGPCRADRLAGT